MEAGLEVYKGFWSRPVDVVEIFELSNCGGGIFRVVVGLKVRLNNVD